MEEIISRVRAVDPTWEEMRNPEELNWILEQWLLLHKTADVVARKIIRDIEWRREFKVDELRLEHVKEVLDSNFLVPIGQDESGRWVIVFRAGYYAPGKFPLIKILETVVFLFEHFLNLEGSSRQVVLVEDLQDFTRAKSDFRLVKHLSEHFLDHYPGRIHRVYAVHAGMVYRLLFKALSPFLDGPLVRLVTVSGDANILRKEAHVKQIPSWLMKDSSAEADVKVFLDSLKGLPICESKGPHEISAKHRLQYENLGFEEARKIVPVIKEGWMKKKGGWMPNSNDRYVVLIKGMLLYYTPEQKDLCCEGWVDLVDGTVAVDHKKLIITSGTGKKGEFKTKPDELDAWVEAVRSAVEK